MSVIKVRQKNYAFLDIQCDPGIANEISDFFTFYAPNYKFTPAYRNKMWDGKIRLFDVRKNELYAGLFPYIKEFCEVEGRGYTLQLELDPIYGQPGSRALVSLGEPSALLFSKGTPITPYDYQVKAVENMLSQKRGIIVSPTGSGKSLMIFLMLRWFLENSSKNVLIVVPTTSLVSQMYGDFLDYANQDKALDKMIHCIFSGKEKINNQRIIISTWQSIYKMPASWFDDFGMVVGDEAHAFKAKSLTSLMTKMRDCEYRIGTTGTIPDNTQVHKLVLEGLFGPLYYSTTTKALMDEGTLAELKINMLILKHSETACRAIVKKTYQEEIDYIVSHEKRNNFITNLALDLDGNTLILFNYVDKHGKPLFKMIKEKAHERRKIFYVSGETKTDIREDVRKITETQKNAIIVASLGTFSTGINIKNLHNIVFASPSKSQIKVLQSIGRGLRKSDDGRITQLYDICDNLSWKSKKNYTFEHGAERLRIYSREKFNFTIHEVPLSD